MANGDEASEELEHARVRAFGATTFGDEEDGRRRKRQPRLHLHQAGGGAATATADDAGSSVDQARAIEPEAPTAPPWIVVVAQIRHLPFACPTLMCIQAIDKKQAHGLIRACSKC